MAKARNRETGQIVDVSCMDDYFGRRAYGYIVHGEAYRMPEFMGKFEFLGGQHNDK